jgi:hypothetical protein
MAGVHQPEVDKFIAWLTGVIEIKGDTRVLLGQRLGPGGKKKIDNDLSGSYLPAWQYVASTYLGPVEEITNAALTAEVLGEGKQLHEAAKQVAEPYTPSEGEHESYSRVVAPVLAGFSLPAIVTLATATTPVQPYYDIALSFFITATGLFLISFQLTIGGVYIRLYNWGKLRVGLTFFGVVFLVAAVMVLVAAAIEYWWMYLALAALGLGGLAGALALLWLKLPISRRSTL